METVKSFRVMSVAGTLTIIGAIFGFLAIPFGAISAAKSGDTSWQTYFSPFHLLILLGTPAVLGFVYGGLGALAYNLIARWTGGWIEVELKKIDHPIAR